MPIALQEELTVRAFIVRQRRERWLELLTKPKRRKEITASLAHPNPAWFDARFTKEIAPGHTNAVSIAKLLRGKGAGDHCWVVSEDSTLDAREIELEVALEEVAGRGMGAILCCVPGKLAFVESEDGRFLLEK